MSHRRPDPRQAGLERALRHALRLAVDSVEPTADGLDRIRAKIAAPPRAVHTGWLPRHLGGLLVVLSAIWRFLEPAAIWLRYWAGAAAERFRPDLGRVGWLGWLRPAAALATGLLVVTGASWAIAALPQMMSPAGEATNYNSGGPGSNGTHATTPRSSQGGGAPGSTEPGRSLSPHASPSCRTSSTAPAGSTSSSPAQSPSPPASSSSSASPSPPASSSSSPPPTGPPTTSASPSGSPTNGPVSVQAVKSALTAGLQVGASQVGRAGVDPQADPTILTPPQYSTPTTDTKPSAGASRKGSCS